MGLLTSDKGVFMAATESVYGTDIIDGNLDITAISYQCVNSDVSIAPVYEEFRPNKIRASQDGVSSVMVPSHNEWSLSHGLRGGVGAPHTPSYGWLLKACGFSEVIGGSDTVYTLTKDIQNSATMYLWRMAHEALKARIITCTGALGNLSIAGEVKQEAIATASGLAASSEDWSTEATWFDSAGEVILKKDGLTAVNPTSAALLDDDIITCQGITLTVGGLAYPCRAFSLDMGMAVSAIETMQATQAATRITRTRGDGANASGTLALEMTDGDTALDDVLTKWKASTEAALSIALVGASERITISCPLIQLQRPEPRDSGGTQGWDVGFSVNGDYSTLPTGDNGIVITYAAA